MAQLKPRLVEVWADFEQTIVNKVTDQWSKQFGESGFLSKLKDPL